MADFGINPNIAMGFTGNQANKPMTLNELVGLTKNVMETSRLAELYPELIRKTQAEVKTAEIGAQKSEMDLRLAKVKAIADGQISMIINPLVQQAEADPNSVDRNALVKLVTDNAIMQSRNAGLDWEKEGQELARTYIETAMNNPGNLMQLYKERHMAGLDAVSRATAFAEGRGVGVSTLPRRPAGVTGQDMTAPLSAQPVAPSQVEISPIQGGQMPSSAQVSAPSGQMVEPNAGVPNLRYKPPVAGIPHAKLVGEDEAMRFGQDFKNSLSKRALNLLRSDENLDHVIRSATKIMKEASLPETGAIGGIKRKFAEFTGDPKYQQLKKDIAQAQQANLNALSAGGNSVAGLELNRDAMGDINYSPDVLIDIARRTKADNTNLRLMYQGMDKHSRRFGDANADRYTQMWVQNADSKIFQLMNIEKDITDPKEKREAAAKVLEGMSPQQRQILNDKYQRINRLVQTGDLTQ